MLLNNHCDSELWEAVRLGDTQAFDALFDRYWRVAYSTAFAYLKDKEACTEVVHDIFLNIWRKRAEFEIQCFKSYLTSAARYHVYKKLRQKKAIPVLYVEDYEGIMAVQQGINSGDENIAYLDLENSVRTSLKKLPQRCREIFVLSRMDHLTNDEIARQLGISKRTVENQITSALQYLRSILKVFPF